MNRSSDSVKLGGMNMAQHPRIQDSGSRKASDGANAISQRVSKSSQQQQQPPLAPKRLGPQASHQLALSQTNAQLQRRKQSSASSSQVITVIDSAVSQRTQLQKSAATLKPKFQNQRQQQTNLNQRQQLGKQIEISSASKNKQQEREHDAQEGKRTLIKNQLCLIEHLQLENASLRNERDQLQLENEELKFQLQMISSSNILSQPNAAATSLEPLVECVGHQQHQPEVGPIPSTDVGSTTGSKVIDLHATPLRRPLAKSQSSSNNSSQQQLGNFQLLTSSGCGPNQNRSSTRQHNFLSNWQHLGIPANQPIAEHAQLSSKMKLLDSHQAETLSGRNRISSSSQQARLTGSADLAATCSNSDEEEQYYDAVSDEVRAAAIIIQKAFRKYQICKRFRTITEQLRHTGRQSELHQHQQPIQSQTQKQTKSSGIGGGVKKAASSQQVNLLANSTTNMTSKKHQQQQPDPAVAAAITNFHHLEAIRKRQYRVGLNIFNKNPEKGISYLVAHSFIEATTPLNKGSSGQSYYYSNQLHFMDTNLNQKQHQQSHQLDQQHLKQRQDNQQCLFPKRADLLGLQNNCKFCSEEENLKQNVAHFLLNRKGLAKEKIGQYLGNLQSSFNQDVLKYYLQELDFCNYEIDNALRKFLATFRLPGEAQKIEKIVDCFAQRYVECQHQYQQQLQQLQLQIGSQQFNQIEIIDDRTISPTIDITPEKRPLNSDLSGFKNGSMALSKDEVFILTFAIIMLNTDLHSPSLKPTSRMSAQQFVNNLRGVFKTDAINESDLIEIYARVKSEQISTAPDHVTHVMKVQQSLIMANFQKKQPPNLCVPFRRLVCFCRLFEVYDVNKKERVGQHQREVYLFNDLLLVTKCPKRARSAATQQFIYRQILFLQGLAVQLFQAPYYNFGIRLFNKTTEETIIMFNARNELDQSRFVDDLSESIAEMDEMESIKARGLVDMIHFKYTEKSRRHELLHKGQSSILSSNNMNLVSNNRSNVASNPTEVHDRIKIDLRVRDRDRKKANDKTQLSRAQGSLEKSARWLISTVANVVDDGQAPLGQPVKCQTKSSSMLNLSASSSGTSADGANTNQNNSSASCSSDTSSSSADSNNDRQNQAIDTKGACSGSASVGNNNQQQQAQNRTIGNLFSASSNQLASSSRRLSGSAAVANSNRAAGANGHNQLGDGVQRRCSTSSVYSLDSGLFLSRDVSPNQSS